MRVARSDELSWQRQAVLARIAAELAVRHKASRDQAQCLLYALREDVSEPTTATLISESLRPRHLTAVPNKNE